jgi:hypothetical protein
MRPVSRLFPNPDRILAGTQFADSYCLIVDSLDLDAVSATRRVMGRTPGWITMLMAMRNFIVRPFGLKTELGSTAFRDAIGLFPVVDKSASRVVLGFDDRHLDFRVLVEVEELGAGRQEVAVSTAVKTHNLLGRAYLALVKPFHRIIVPAMLAQVLTGDDSQPAGVTV